MEKLEAKVTKVIKQTHDVWSINFLVDGRPLPAEAGQYISVYFDDTNIPEGKAYSLSSIPSDHYSQITVKKVGLFSTKLTNLKVGDTFLISYAYGFFDAFSGVPAVFIGSGVGISPLFSIIRNELTQGKPDKLSLFYTNKTVDDIIFQTSIDQLVGQYDNFKCTYYITRQANSPYLNKRFTINELEQLTPDTCYYLCGTTNFTRDIWQQLVQNGVPEKQITVEVFFGDNRGE